MQIPPGVRDFTYIDDIVEGIVRVIDTPPAKGTLEARVPEGGRTEGTPSYSAKSTIGNTTDAAPSPQHNANPKPATNINPQNPTEEEKHEHSTEKLEARSSLPKFSIHESREIILRLDAVHHFTRMNPATFCIFILNLPPLRKIRTKNIRLFSANQRHSSTIADVTEEAELCEEVIRDQLAVSVCSLFALYLRLVA